MVGSALLELWKIDSSVISGVRFHHSFEKAPFNHCLIVAITHLAEYILCNWALGSFEGTMKDIHKNIWDTLKIPPDSLGTLFSQAEAQVERADLILAMEMGDKNTQLRFI
jgi:HD-like signal output (HDOD) protein